MTSKLQTKGLLFMYDKQVANVHWKNNLSQSFPISNVAAMSAILSSVYVNDLYKLLRKRRSGC